MTDRLLTYDRHDIDLCPTGVDLRPAKLLTYDRRDP